MNENVPMTLGRRGDIGFAEAMTGTVVVCMVLSVFTVFAVTMVTAHSDDGTGFDWTLTRDLTISGEEFEWDADEAVNTFIEDRGLNGVGVTLECNISTVNDRTYTFGELDGDRVSERRVIEVDTDDGRRVPVTVTVILCG